MCTAPSMFTGRFAFSPGFHPIRRVGNDPNRYIHRVITSQEIGFNYTKSLRDISLFEKHIDCVVHLLPTGRIEFFGIDILRFNLRLDGHLFDSAYVTVKMGIPQNSEHRIVLGVTNDLFARPRRFQRSNFTK